MPSPPRLGSPRGYSNPNSPSKRSPRKTSNPSSPAKRWLADGPSWEPGTTEALVPAAADGADELELMERGDFSDDDDVSDDDINEQIPLSVLMQSLNRTGRWARS